MTASHAFQYLLSLPDVTLDELETLSDVEISRELAAFSLDARPLVETTTKIVFISKISRLIATQAEDIDLLSDEEILEECRQLGLNPELATERLSHLTRNPDGQLSVPEAINILRLVGDSSVQTAANAASCFLSLWHDHNAIVLRCLHQLMQAPLDGFRRAVAAQKITTQPVAIRAYKDFEDQLSIDDVVDWINKPTTEIYPLVEGPGRRVWAVTVDPGAKRFEGAWLEVSPVEHYILINESSTVINVLSHELMHVLEAWSMHRTKEDEGDESKRRADAAIEKAQRNVLFAQAQKEVDPHDKAVVARWVGEELLLFNGAGIFVDAGSSCMQAWENIREQIAHRRFANLTVYTNSFMVLQDWADHLMIPQLQGTTVEVAGDVFDAPHLAFYGAGLRARLMSGHFRPAAVYIGTSGIEFDEEGHILLGYHAGELERDAKEVLFQCPAKRRIIFATPGKIGNAGGRVFDVLSVNKLDARAPIYLVTTAPEDSGEGNEEFEQAKKLLMSKKMREALNARGVEFHWITVDRDSKAVPKALEHLIVPEKKAAGR